MKPTASLKIALLFFLVLSTQAGFAQKDTFSIELTPFVTNTVDGQNLLIAVRINPEGLDYGDSVEIDDRRSWASCINTFGVKLIWEGLEDNCFMIVDRSECHPLGPEDLQSNTRILRAKKEYSYVLWVGLATRRDMQSERVLRTGPYRFKLELPYKVNGTWRTARSKRWVYFAPAY